MNFKPTLPAGYPRKLFIDRGRAAKNARDEHYPVFYRPLPCIAILDEGKPEPMYAYAVDILGPSKFCHDTNVTTTPAAWIETNAELVLTMMVAI